MLKIAISGKASSGKNTAANIVASHIASSPIEFEIVAFADKIKELVTIMFPGCDQNALYGNSELRQNTVKSDIGEFNNLSFRQITTDLGKFARNYDPLFWIYHLKIKLNQAINNKKKLFIISDLRFIDEFMWCKNEGFSIIRIKKEKTFNFNDVSETEQDQLPDDLFDHVIYNDGSMEELAFKIHEIYNKLAYL